MGGPLMRWWGRVRASVVLAIGDITFGMEDGAVSVSGLVLGVSASTDDSSVVLLAGAAGAVAGAVSMMAGTYLDVQSGLHRDRAEVEAAQAQIALDPTPFLRRAEVRLTAIGFTHVETQATLCALQRDPAILLDHVAAYEIGHSTERRAEPWTHAGWMFAADLFAASIPVIPFAVLPIQAARVVSLLVTGALMAVLGVARGHIGRVNVWRTAIETMAIAGLAALAGAVIGRIVT